MTASTYPGQSPAPSVAFEIPINKDGSSSPAVQKRLAAQANSPRGEVSLADFNKKLEEASKRKEAIDIDSNAKTTSHNAQVKRKYEESMKLLARDEGLEKRIGSKLNNAEAKRDGLKNTWARRLSAVAKSKVQRAAKVRDEKDWRAKELESKIDIKGLAADLRREEARLRAQDELAASNHDKVRRGRLAIGLAEVEAKHVEIHSEHKIAAADHRREMKQVLTQARMGQSAAEKRERASGALRKEEEEAAQRRDDIAARFESADRRKNEIIAGRKQNSDQINDKLQRAADLRRQGDDERAREHEERINSKVELATRRREDILRAQQRALVERSEKKERRVVDRQRQEESERERRLRDARAKIQMADARKEDIIAAKVEAAKSDQRTKQDRAKGVWLSSLKETKKLRQTSEKRLQDAAERKSKMTEEQVTEIQDANKKKIKKIAKMNKNKELEELQSLASIEKKLAVAFSSRKKNLIAKSSPKKRALSPRAPSPKGKDEIEARIDRANWRRDIYLAEKVEKARREKSPKINKTLFAAVSPQRKTEDSPQGQRIKASRLEEFHDDNGPKHQVFNMPLLAISGIAVVIVGLLSFLKSK